MTRRRITLPRAGAARWIAVAILLHIALWIGWLAFAGRHPVAEVPLAVG
jgi:hypothetical protein